MSCLLVDIGNTNIKFGVSKNNKIIKKNKKSFFEFKKVIKKTITDFDIQKSIICSVVPKRLKELKKIFKQKRISLYICGKNINIPVANRYKYPEQVGQDRLVNIYAANKLYENIRLVVDLGTAVTFDFISKRGEYLGGLIFPGIDVSLETLLHRCALLPEKVDLSSIPVKIKGKTTRQSIASGMVFGYSFLIKGMVDYIKKDSKDSFKVILTGGGKRFLIKKITRKDYIYDPYLSLKGLNLLVEKI